MTIIKTPFGDIDSETGQLVGGGTVVDTPAKPSTPAAPDPLSLTYDDPSVCHTEEARSDLEALRFKQLRRLTVMVNGVCLAHKCWEARTKLEKWEQAKLAEDRSDLMYFRLPSSGDHKVELAEAGPNVTLDDVKAIAALFSHRRVYWQGAEVTV